MPTFGPSRLVYSCDCPQNFVSTINILGGSSLYSADGCGAGEELVRMGDESVCMPCEKGFVREDLQNQMCVACSDPLYTTPGEGRVNLNQQDNEAEDCVIRESNLPCSSVYACSGGSTWKIVDPHPPHLKY